MPGTQKMKKQKTPWNVTRKARQSSNWAKQKARKEKRQNTQNAAHARNVQMLYNGGSTPWRDARNSRKTRRTMERMQRAN